jgi:predicted nucleotidyltransferase
LFGSRARGDGKPDSDYDIAVFLKDAGKNERKDVDGGRFPKVLSAVSGKRITWKELTTHASPAA